MVYRILIVLSSISISTISLSNPSINAWPLTNHIHIQALKNLLQETNIVYDQTFDHMVAATQQEQPTGWLRPRGKERWEIAEIFAEKRTILFKQFDQLGMLAQISPTKKQYDYVLFLGATLSRVRLRLQYLFDLWENGVRFKSIVILAGQRPLDQKIEPLSAITNAHNGICTFKEDWTLSAIPTTEIDMIKVVFEQTQLPKEWHNIPLIFINTPMKQTATGLQRPTTEDTILAWMTQKPTPGSLLAISSQPHINYQDLVVRNYIPSSFSLETVGPAEQSSTIAILLDATTRWLYQLQKNFKKT